MASSVNLGPKLEATVDDLVKNGRYGSRSEVLREGVRLVEEREAAIARFKAEMMKGIEDAEAGRDEDIDVFFGRLIADYEARAAKKAA